MSSKMEFSTFFYDCEITLSFLVVFNLDNNELEIYIKKYVYEK